VLARSVTEIVTEVHRSDTGNKADPVLTTCVGEITTQLPGTRHVCDALGIDWKSQHVKIKADPVLAKGVVEMTTPSAGGSQRTAMLPIEFLSEWPKPVADHPRRHPSGNSRVSH